ncbi:MAG: protein kinase [Bryobacterales bacterium]|nr:protein kinase [Bryobacterales bacterium]
MQDPLDTRPGEWARVRMVLEQALDLPPNQRQAFVDKACDGNPALLREVNSLLAASGEPAILDQPANLATLPAGTTPGVPQVLGHYRMESRIGEGGMGTVYKAVDTRLQRVVALKVISRDTVRDTDRKRFAREAKAASALNHPNVVIIYDFGSAEGMDYIAMEYVEGRTLHHALQQEHRPLPELLEYARQAAGAIAKAHAAGIVHRDLKPGNIMVTREGQVKVLDFGLAKQTAPRESDAPITEALTGLGDVLGTPAYMSPEQAKGDTADARSDIFSFGVILYELVCGTRPFQARSASATLVQIAMEEPVPAAQRNPHAPAEVLALIERCLRKKPAERPQSMDEVVASLTRALQPAPVAPNRRPVLVGAAVSALLAVAAWLAIPTSQQPPEAPVVMQYAIEAQRMEQGQPAGEPYTASPHDVFEAGWKFRVTAHAPRGGYLYLINDGPDAGVNRLWVLHPSKADLGKPLAVSQPARTGWFVFDRNPGKERLWVVWSASPLPELDAPVRGESQGKVTDPAAEAHLRSLLSKLAPVAGSQLALRTSQDLAAGLVELQHR